LSWIAANVNHLGCDPPSPVIHPHLPASMQHGHARRQRRSGRGTVDLAGLDRHRATCAQAIRRCFQLPGEQTEREMSPIRICWMMKAKRPGRSFGDFRPKLGDIMRLVRGQGKAHGAGIDDHETVAAKGRVYGPRTQPFDLQLGIQFLRKAGRVLNKYALGLAVPAWAK
jgi:hypothetical protein